ncbi:acyl CoA:acetate/3-ketoacid CoA transferase [Neobacillus mesonae]|uniref:Acyl CoA:acetate/3-ketoacid CoA transferase n=1 Tax=Neobacillus mesonae TaxID=1193713 RepID=A0A3Q9QZT8_9BACI|nr:CoA-transferase [Neobacillus mesonae]AZU64453.1 acyl CoA:acetate/3-ketoacid CoA transferase [Neobacillus mesonae]
MAVFLNPEEIARNIQDGSTIALVGFGGMGQCDSILKGIRESFLRTGHPRDLTVYHAAGQSDKSNGIEYIAEEGLLRRVIGGHWGLAPKMKRLIEENKIEAYCFPQGQLTHLFRTMASGLPGQLSRIGLGTFVDPRKDGGKFNERTKEKEDLVKLVTIEDEEYLFYKSIPIDYVFIRGTTIDEGGNMTTEEEALKLEVLSAAQAVRANGGNVVAQVKYLASSGTLHPKDVTVPGYLIDFINMAKLPEINHRQIPSAAYNPVFSGNARGPSQNLELLPLSIRKIIGRRAVHEMPASAVANIGIGIPGDVIGPILHEEHLESNVVLTLESGVIGGLPLGENQFGIAHNADAILDHEYLFDYYHGTGVDIAFMGAAEVDINGNVNVSKFGNRIAGCGGFIDITQPAKKVVFCTTFTGGGLDAVIENCQLRIIREGTIKKFVKDVSQITFSGEYASDHHQQIIYVTERAVFELSQEGLILKEIAPGIDLMKDVLAHMEFTPIVDENLKPMDLRIFSKKSMELQAL